VFEIVSRSPAVGPADNGSMLWSLSVFEIVFRSPAVGPADNVGCCTDQNAARLKLGPAVTNH
jgi:hypothetical protein